MFVLKRKSSTSSVTIRETPRRPSPYVRKMFTYSVFVNLTKTYITNPEGQNVKYC